jgi:hypothetical protein
MLRKTGALAGLMGLGVLVLYSWHSSYAVTGPSVIRITDREVQRTIVDVGEGGLSPGDLEVSRQVLYNKRITTKAIGHGELVCTFTGGNSRNCSGTFVLPKGKIVVGGTILYRQLYQLAILGGTDLYNDVRGTLTVTLTSKRPPEDVLLFRLSG